jgi:hypothetical protein
MIKFPKAFAALAFRYRNRGFSPIPIMPGTKRPGYARKGMDEWQRYCKEALDPQAIAGILLMDPYAGIGLAMGFNDVIGIDVDDPRAYPVTRDILGSFSAPVKVGRKGGTAIYRGPGLKSQKFRSVRS